MHIWRHRKALTLNRILTVCRVTHIHMHLMRLVFSINNCSTSRAAKLPESFNYLTGINDTDYSYIVPGIQCEKVKNYRWIFKVKHRNSTDGYSQ